MKSYDVSRLPTMITLGYDGENNWRPNRFDCSSLLANHPNGTISLWLLPKGESQAFPVALERDGNTVIWTPLSEEMTAEHGQLQITVQDGTDVGKSKVVDYTVHDSLVSGADHPAETPSWATQVVADVTEQADRAEEAAESIGESIGEQLPGANRGLYNASSASSKSGDATCCHVFAYGADHQFDLEVDADYDLGNHALYSGDSAIMTRSYGKGYCNIINNHALASGEMYALRGKYCFKKLR